MLCINVFAFARAIPNKNAFACQAGSQYPCLVKVNTKGRVGIRDVAAAAGVSATTVSHALNGKGRLPDSTRERIAQVANELGYRPNASARNLVAGKTGRLGIAVSSAPGVPFGLSDFDYFIQMLSSATTAALEHGLALVVAGPNHEQTAFERIEIDGAIVIDPVVNDPLVSDIRTRGLPLVTTGRIPSAEATPDDGTCWVDNDHVAGTRSILDHLADQGAERIALLTSTPVTSYTSDAAEGYETWCAEHGCEPLVSIAEGALNEGSGFVAAAALLDMPEPPDAIYATLDRLALGALLAARAREVKVPDELLLAGCTDSQASEWAQPPLTALALDPEEIGRQAVEMLITLIEGDRPRPKHQYVPTRVLTRESTAKRGS